VVAPAVFAVFLAARVSLARCDYRLSDSVGRADRHARAGFAALVAGLFAVCAQAATVSFSGPTEVGQLAAPPRNEGSGLAASCRTPELLWTHDDSGGQPVLYAVAADGKLRGSLRVNGVQNVDWEDIASGEFKGKPCLIVGDTGDNDEKRRSISLHVVEEPGAEKLSPGVEISAAPLASLRVIYEDGARDCEAIAFDAKEGAVYLLTKRNDVPRLYRVALPAELKSGDVRARFVGFVPRLPQPNAVQKMVKGHLGKRRGWPTSMDFTADGSAAIVLTYGDVAWFERRSGESWADALGREPAILAAHLLPQAEAICFSRDGAHIFVASELARALVRYDRR
jgi:hypothetical protein